MCGIAGFYTIKKSNFESNHNTLIEMLKTLKHRGPDNIGSWINNSKDVFFGHTRLSIIDLSNAANQPMISSCKRYVLVFNGEIYNFNDLKKYLKNNTKLKTTSDTEVLLELISIFGLDKAISLIQGMFALALYDIKQNKIFLVRDRIGEKPLYYYYDTKIFIFASEIKPFLKNNNFQKKINQFSLNEYFKYGYISAPNSIFNNLSKVKPGEIAEFKIQNGVLKKYSYWKYQKELKILDNQNNYNLDYYANTLESKIINSINNQRLADVPVGAFLSGGIDSSLIVSILNNISDHKTNTFTIGFEDQRLDESKHASKIAKYLNTSHNELKVNNVDLINTVDRLTNIYDEPFSDSSQIPTVLLSELTKQNVTVALSGDGGDELFGGYSRYIWSNKIKNINYFLKKVYSLIVNNLSDRSINNLYDKLKVIIPKKYDFKMPADKIKKINQIINLNNINDIYERLNSVWFEEDNLLLNQNQQKYLINNIQNQIDMMYQDILKYLPDDLLVKLDRAAMSCSLETRAPFLDHQIVEFSSRIPLKFKINGNNQKIILKKILKKYLPDHLFKRPKMGFEVPIDDWIRGPLKDFTYDKIYKLRQNSYVELNFKNIDKKIMQHMEGTNNWHYQIWNLLVFQQWCEEYL